MTDVSAGGMGGWEQMDDATLAQVLHAANPDGLWVTDDRGITIYGNENLAQMFGVPRAELPGRYVGSFLDEQGARDFAGHLARMVATGEPGHNVESLFVRPDGSTFWGLVTYVPILDAAGNRTGWLNRVTHYTEFKELQIALAGSEHRLAEAQRIAHIGSWEWDLATNTVTWSDEMYRIMGLEIGSPVSPESYRARIHPEDRHSVDEAISTDRDDDELTFDHRVIVDSGVRWVRGRGVSERDASGRVVRISGTAQDVTDLVLSDAQIEETGRRLFMLQQLASAANVCETLRQALEIVGAGVPLHTTWFPLGALMYGDGEPELLDFASAGPPVGFDGELAERARSSRELTIATAPGLAETHCIVSTPVLVNGDVVAVLQLLADEAPPDENSHQLLTQIANQLGVVAQREQSALALAEARDDAMEASRLKSEFLATMSHEIRTPMNGVIGLTDLLMRTPLDDHQRRLTENLQSAGLTLLSLINDILDLSKIEAGKLELETADFDVRSVFEQAASVLSGPAHEKGLELVVACHPDVPEKLSGDPGRFGQIITNLGANAVKFTDTGEVVITGSVVESTEGEVVLRVDVTDTGVGVPASERDRLFDAFTQADPSTTRRHGGTGLGLAISKQLAEALGGEIWMTSEPGRGSTFSFTARFATTNSTAGPPEPLQDLEGRRVLIVDDNETNRFILEEQLNAWQTQPLSVSSAEAALTVLRDAADAGRPFDAALLDQVMPGTDGLGLARRMQDDPTLSGVAKVLLSSEQTVTRRDVDAVGIRAWLSKPVRHSELRNALMAVVGTPSAPPSAPAPAQPKLGARVLIVEDNPVNQLVATGLLENLGCSVEVANDGLEGVERLRGDHGYAAVLMDCRMPRMDGYDATREIRRLEAEGRRVPIIAMTASALEGERERCLGVGMDDFLTKPVDAAALERVIRTWVDLDQSAPAEESPATTDPDLAGVLDMDRVTMLQSLVKDGVNFFDRTSAAFTSKADEQLQQVRDAVAAGDAMTLQTTSHTIKGAAMNLGLPRLADVALQLEELGVAGDTRSAEPLLAVLTGEMARAVAALQRASSGPS